MYGSQTYFGFTNTGSKKHNFWVISSQRMKNGTWTPCMFVHWTFIFNFIKIGYGLGSVCSIIRSRCLMLIRDGVLYCQENYIAKLLVQERRTTEEASEKCRSSIWCQTASSWLFETYFSPSWLSNYFALSDSTRR